MIITSLLDTDLYKFTMQQAVIEHYPDTIVRYELILRTTDHFPHDFHNYLHDEISSMTSLYLSADETDFLRKDCPWFKPPYIDFLKGYRFNPDEITIHQNDGALNLTIEGYWYRTVLWEVPVLATISECYYQLTQPQINSFETRHDCIRQKAMYLESIGAHFTDFGTRRRFSYENHEMVVHACKHYAPTMFIGTSNPHFAMKSGCKVMGTQAHEWFMVIGALSGYLQANRIALEKWIETYNGKLGIALSDTYTSKQFLLDFDDRLARIYDGVRQDSGDPFLFVEQATRHYQSLNIDPLTKVIIFSDFLNVNKVTAIEMFCKGRIKTSYGIGTNLTNNVGVMPLNMVIKLTALKHSSTWISTVKLSDDPTKYTGTPEAVSLCKSIFNIQ